MFDVVATGSPPLFYQWRFQGADIPDATNSTFIISNTVLENTGQYSVLVSNVYGTDLSIPAMLLVQYPPYIITQPQSHSASAYGSTSFTVEPGGTSPFQYQWRFNGADISGATNQTLVLTNIQPTQDGNYSVLVMNHAGMVLSSNALLTLNLAAHIVTPPQSVSTNPGVNVTFAPNVTGSVPMLYQWRFNGADISGATNVTLTISNTALEHAGDYTLFVSNAYGSDLSAPATLTVLVKPMVVEQPSSYTLAVGDSVTIGVGMYGLQPMSFRWLKNGVNYISPTPGLSNLVFTNLVLTNAGQYRTAVTNAATTIAVNSRSETLIVVAPPTNQWVEPGATVIIRAALAGYAPAIAPLSFAWEHSGTILVSSNMSGSGTLIVTNDYKMKNVTEYNSGIYTLYVTNSTPVGSNSSSTFVTAFPMRLTVATFIAPEITEQPTNETVAAGGTASFHVGITGTEPLSYQWWFNETNLIDNATNAVLIVPNVSSNNVGAYQVVVSNPLGSATSTNAFLTVTTNATLPNLGGLVTLQALRLSGESNAVLILLNISSNQACRLEVSADCDGGWATVFDVSAVSSNRVIAVTNVISGTVTRRFFRVSAPAGP
jgi:hypothetical protein